MLEKGSVLIVPLLGKDITMTLAGIPNHYSNLWPLEIYPWQARYYFAETHFKEQREWLTLQTLVFSVILHAIVYKIDMSFLQLITYITPITPIKTRQFLDLVKKRAWTCLIPQDILQSIEHTHLWTAILGKFKILMSSILLKLEFLQKWKWLLSFLTRDRHQQVRAYIKKEKPNINHQFRIWHVGKSLKKKPKKVDAKT